MGRARDDRSGNRPFHWWARGWGEARQAVQPSDRWCSGSYRPRLEILEDRLYPGDTVLGFWAVSLWGRSLASSDRPFEIQGANLVRDSGSGLSTGGAAQSLFTLVLPEDSAGEGERDTASGNSAVTVQIL